MRRAAKVDRNQPEIVEALRQVGASVQSLASVGQGVPDLLVSFRQSLFLLELKTPKGTLTDDQKTWIAQWNSPVYVVRSVEEAYRVIGAIE